MDTNRLKLFLSIENEMLLAVDKYSEAIECDPYDSTLFCNSTSRRQDSLLAPWTLSCVYLLIGAYARMKLEENGYALSDASRHLLSSAARLRSTARGTPLLIRIPFFFFSPRHRTEPKIRESVLSESAVPYLDHAH